VAFKAEQQIWQLGDIGRKPPRFVANVRFSPKSGQR
jgi:hypothetical protein